MSTSFRILSLVAIFAFGFCAVASGQAFDPAAKAETISPFLDSQAIAVGHVDIERIDPAALVKSLGELAPAEDVQFKEQLSEMEQHLKLVKTTLRSAGIHNLYAVLSLADLPQGGLLVVAPMKAGGNPEMAADMLRELLRSEAAAVISGSAVCGSQAAIDRLKGMKEALRPELAKAFEAAGDTTAQIVFVPNNDTRRVLHEMLPRLPEKLGDVSGQDLANGVQWAAVGVNAPPKLSIKLTIQSKDAQSAAAIQRVAERGLALAKNEKELIENIPNLDELVRLLTPEVKEDRVVLDLSEDTRGPQAVVAVLTPAVQKMRMAAGRMQSANNLKQIALALHNYHDTHRRLPPQAIRGKDGKALLSWRVAILPFIEGNDLYKKFRLDEPWDSEHNKALIDKMPAVFASPSLMAGQQAKGMTNYLVPLTRPPAKVAIAPPDDPTKPVVNGKDEMVFDLPQGTQFMRILDGTSNTIMVLEVNRDFAVAWTKPDDLVIDPADPAKALRGQPNDGFNSAFCDGSVHFIKASIEPKTLLHLLQMNDGNVIGEF